MIGTVFVAAAVTGACAVMTALLIVLLKPTFAQHFMPASRLPASLGASAPQGAGIAIVAAMLTIYVGLWGLGHLEGDAPWPVPVLSAAVALTALGAIDDVAGVPLSWRLAGQVAAAVGLVLNLPAGFVLLPHLLPLLAERLILIAAVIAMVNAVSLTDGIGWIALAEAVPMTGAVIVLGLFGAVPDNVVLLALVLLGGLLGFAVFNKPPARIFLGDAGGLPIGICLAWTMVFVAKADFAASLLLPLVTLADGGLTLVSKLNAGKHGVSGHRSEVFRQALGRGLKVPTVITSIFTLSLVLAGLAVTATLLASRSADLILFGTGLAVTSLSLRLLMRGRL